jgi:hypothetical protein
MTPRNPMRSTSTPLKKILKVITENFMKMILDMINQNVQDALKKFQDTKNKKYEKTQEQINELIGALNKHQSETENTINREINELKMKIDNIKEEETYEMENFRKKSETETQNTMEGHSSRLEKAEDRISECEDKMEIKGKIEELLINNSSPVKGICKNSLTPSKHQT